MANNSIDLTQFDDDFRSETPAERSDMESVPDGKYQVVVEKVEIDRGAHHRQPDAEVDAPRPRAALRQPPHVAQQRLHRTTR